MIDFEGYYLVPPDQVAYIETRRGGGDASLRASCMKAGLTVLCWRGSACCS